MTARVGGIAWVLRPWAAARPKRAARGSCLQHAARLIALNVIRGRLQPKPVKPRAILTFITPRQETFTTAMREHVAIIRLANQTSHHEQPTCQSPV